eukprot:TRINITY_DN54374_c0_g1_i1.p3 TRINITY_DN54374_c0_g1~~TRINITY_DN54374_c0_g1_i1.p3  ORF type:complete len:105 (-),score=20.04 TRINITY_DN54374_c0_g1_i1:39-329(-)
MPDEQSNYLQLRQEASDWTEKQLETNGDVVDLWLGLGFFAKEQEVQEFALNTAISLDKKNGYAWVMLGRLYAVNGKHEAAEECFQHTRTLGPGRRM